MAENNESNQEQPKYMTDKDLNGALTAHKKEIQKLLNNQSEQQNAFLESIKSLVGPKQEAQPLPTKGELAEDTAELKKQIKILMERDKQRDETEKSMKKTNSLRESLNKAGIKSRDELAIKYLQDQVSYDEDGQLVMKVDGIPLPLSEAVAKFSQTEHGKFLADPRDVRGSGAGNAPNQSRSLPQGQSQVVDVEGTPIFKDLASLKAMSESFLAKREIVR